VLETAGASPGTIHRILLTHQDIDHIGNAAALEQATDEADVLGMPYIEGRKPLITADPERMLARLSSAAPEFREKAEALLRPLALRKGGPNPG